MGKYRTRELTQRVRYALLAGVAGAFLIPQVAAAAPTGHHGETNGVHVAGEGTATTTITATAANNVIKWADYSVKQGETVNYDGKNYLNIVTGGNTSAINGTINNTGGDIYLVNPNGVIFGKTASVNVGNLYVSTQEESTLNMTAFTGSGNSPLSTSAGDVGKADVVNMGSITANKVEVYGRSIRILDAANVHATTSPVILHTDTAANDGYAHIGYKSGAEPAATAYEVNGANAVAADNYYQLVSTTSEFRNMSSDLTKNYMLENDIDFAGETALSPTGTITTPFTKKFDGNFYKVKNFTVMGGDRAGLFGDTNGASIENVGIIGATITGGTAGADYAGGIVAYARNSTLRNVYVDQTTTVSGTIGKHGGIAGGTSATTIDSAYSKASIGAGGGVIGHALNGTVVRNTYSDARVSGTGTYFIYYMQPPDGTSVSNSYTTGNQFTWSNLTSHISNTYKIDEDAKTATLVSSPSAGPAPTPKSMSSVATYAGWSINNTGAPGAKWRIYEGRTLPLLTAFMDGTATATYDTRYFNANGTLNSDGANTAKSNKGADIETTYNSQYVKIVGKDASGADVVGGKSNVVTYAGAMQYKADGKPNLDHIYDYVGTTGTNDFDKTNGIRNAGTKAILWSDQDGPNLRGVNVTVKQRVVSLDNGTIKPDRMYNGKSDVTDAFIHAVTNGSIKSSGFTKEDIEAHSVNLNYTAGNFKARVYNLAYENASGVTIAAGTHADKNVGVDKPVKFTGSIDFSGDDAANYKFDNASLSNITGKVTITKAPLYLKINKTRADAKIYDGTDAVLDPAMKQTGTTTPNITLNKDNHAPASTVTSPTHHKGEIMLDDGDNPDDVDLTQVTDPTYTDTTGAKQIHVGDHSLQYKNVGLRGADAGNYDLYLPPIPAVGNGNKVVGNTVYLAGEIIRREIPSTGFEVYKKVTDPLTSAVTQVKVDAEKVYDGTSSYTPESGTYLTSNITTTEPNKGIVARDLGHITFSLTPGKMAHFTDDNGTETTHVSNTTGVAYNVTGHTDNAAEYQLGDYYIKVKVNGSDVDTALTNTFDVTGKGKITPKLLTATVVNSNIKKVYDGWTKQTDGNRTLTSGEDLITLAGFVTGETRTNTSTADYATKNVIPDGSGTPTKQNVTYTASFDRGTGVASEDYILDAAATGTNRYQKTLTTDSSGAQTTGIITPRPVTVKFADVTKVYDGTAINTDITANDLGDTAVDKAVLQDDGKSASAISATGITSRYGDGTAVSFAENRNAGSRAVEYVGLAGVLGTNYAVDNKQYGKGTITRRRIDPSGFQVRKDGTIANASKVYDGTDISDLPDGASLVTPTATSGNTGIVAHDEGKITFKLKDGTSGYYSSDRDGNNRTSHVSEAKYVAYDIVAQTSDDTNNPLTNYTFGSAAAEAAGTLKNLEKITNTNPAHVTADGTITPAALHAQTHSIKKVYDGLAAHTDGNRADVADKDTIITFTGWVIHNGITEKRTNNSSAVYLGFGGGQGKDVAYDMDGITTKNVTYTAALTGNYANDYEIVDITGAGAATAGVTTTVADAGKITPRALKIVMDDVSKTYDGNAKNTTVSVKEITDTIGSAVIDDILSDDNVTAHDLTTKYTAKMTAAPANYKSTYGRGNTDAMFVENVNASNGTPHDVQYTNMRKAFNEEFGTFSAGNYSVEKNVYGKGTINRRNIDPSNFRVVDDHNVPSHATKEYDGTTTYNVPTGWKLTPPSGPSTGVIAGDDVTFHLTSDGAQFTTVAHNPTPNAYDADKVMYNVAASGDREKIKNYTLGGRKLEDGKAKVYGEGKITRRVLSLALVNNTDINKVYDGQTGVADTDTKHWKALTKTDAKGNVTYTTASKELVNDGSSFNIEANYRNSANTANDKNVAYDSATPRHVIDKAIEYNIHITGGDARNYAFGALTNPAESGLKLSATGKITPKDLSGAFEKVTKVYDGTKNVPAADVKFKKGADGVIDGDNITFTHSEEFQSANVNGDDNHTWTPTEGPEKGKVQKNWINYSGLTLGGTSADNYTINATAVGLGEITPLELNPSTVTLVTTQATKEYDGGVKVKKDGSDAISAIKNYITDATVTVGGSPVSVLPDLELQSAEYDTKNVVGGPQPRVTYHMKYKGTSGNFTLAPGAATFDGKGKGVITPKDVTATIKGPLTKVYDATANMIGAAKNATGAAVVTADDLVKFVGLVAGDGATNATTATFDNKNVGTNKTVTYDIKLDTASAGNYNLKYNGSAITAAITQAGNTITKRKVDVTFGEQHKPYDGLSKNTSIDASVSAADAAVLNRDVTGLAVADKLTNLTATGTTPNIISNYGKRTGTDFTTDANAGTNKDVQYAGLRTAMNASLGGNAGNYEFDTDGYGKGYIERATINVNDPSFTFTATDAKKVYDGTRDVKYNGSAASNDVRNYITSIGVTLNGHWVDLSGSVVMDLAGTKYTSPNATNGTPDTVTYKFRLNTNNIIVNGGTNEFTKTAQGTIDRRVLKLGLAQDSAIDKIYDANEKLIDTSTRHYDKFIDDDANGNVIYAAGIANDNKLVRTSNGAAVNDGAKMTITANYVDNLTNRAADKNVARVGGNVTAKDIAYNVKIDAANGGKNYTLDHNGTTANAEDGLKMNASGTISPRKITLAFADADKMYDTMSENTLKNISSVTPGNSDGRGAATLTADGITAATFDMTGVASDFGKGTANATFTADPNVVLNSSGTVSPRSKDVQYRNLKDTLNAQPYAGNYEIADTAYGKGAITKRTVTRNDFDIQIDPATKEYDGTDKVVWTDPRTHISYNDLEHAKNYFTSSTLKLRNSEGTVIATKNINLADIELLSAAYNGTNVVGTNQVDYGIRINTTNFDFTGSRDDVRHTAGTITPRDLATKLPTHLIKEYDGETTFNQDNKDFVNAMANEKLTGIVARDANKVHLAVTGTYSSKNASAETKAEAEARTPAQAQRTVDYTLTLSGDAATLANYTIAGHDTTHTVTGKAADIYKKTLTVDVARKEKDYDGTAAVNNLAAGDITFSGLVGSETLSLDSGALNKVQGQYLDSSGNADANVSRDVHRNVLDKAVKYTGFNDALTDLATRNNTAKNYRVADGGKSYTVNAAKGRINPLSINPNHPTDGVTTTFDAAGAMKIYDRTRAVKYNGQSTSDALKNYLTSATVRVGTQTIDIKDELTIDPNATAYDNKNAGTGKTVTYTLKYTGNNFAINDFTRNSTGEIKQKDVKVLPVGTLTKVYDGTRYVYANGDDSIRTMHGDQRVTNGDSVVELENGGIIAGDSVQNNSTAVYADKNAGTGKTVVYTPSITGADAGNYRLVDVFGHAIPSGTLTTTDNVIQKRRLNIGFDGLNGTLPVRKSYDATTTNDKITARITDDPNGHTRTVLQRDGMGIFGDRLAQLNNGNIQSDYGYGSTDATFRADANADARKDVQYRGVGDALRNILGGNAANYDFNETAYSDGAITRANVTRSVFDLGFDMARKEYDGTKTVVNPARNLTTKRVRLGGNWNTLQDGDVLSVTGEYAHKNAAASQPVDYKVKFNTRNFNITDSADNTVAKQGSGEILRRKIMANPVTATKTYDKTSALMNVAKDGEGHVIDSADRLVKFSHYGGHGDAIIANDVVENRSTGEYADQNVAWEPKANANPNAMWQDRNRVKNKAVNYQFLLAGDDALNYELVDGSGNTLSTDGLDANGKNTIGYAPAAMETGRINPYEVRLAGDDQTRWINEGLPDSYTGTPQGRGYTTALGETLPGEIRYGSPSARLRWGDYPIEGEYIPATDSETVYQNYLFKSSGTLHIGPYIPDYEYYKAMTQVSKMTPDEYAYENASLDRTNHYSRKPSAQVDPVPPAINVVKDGVDISKTDIRITDETVFSLVNEVFG